MSKRGLDAPRMSFVLKGLHIRVFADHVEMDAPCVNLTVEETEQLTMVLCDAANHIRNCATGLTHRRPPFDILGPGTRSTCSRPRPARARESSGPRAPSRRSRAPVD